jgi:hypothetical protein
VRRSECVPNNLGSSPTLPIHSDTSRAYWRVVMLRLLAFVATENAAVVKALLRWAKCDAERQNQAIR